MLDDLCAIAEALSLKVEHHRDTALRPTGESFWPATSPYLGTLAERDPFLLVEQEQRGRSVIPRGVLKFSV